jgi:GNAT superfamily N-acetyltransferase
MIGASRKARIALRDMTAADIDRVQDWVGTTWAWGAYSPVTFDEWLADPSSVVRVAVMPDDRIVGVQHYERLDPYQCWLSGLRVHPDHRGQGIATRLLKDAIEIAQHDGLRVLRYATEAVHETIHYLSETIALEPRGTWLSFERSMDAAACGLRRTRPMLGAVMQPLSQSDKVRVLPLLLASGRHFYVRGWAWRTLDDGLLTSLIERRQAFFSRSDLGGWSLSLLGSQDDRGLEATLYGTDAASVQTALEHVTQIACEAEGATITIHVPQHGPAAGLVVDLARRGEWCHSVERALRIWECNLVRIRAPRVRRGVA